METGEHGATGARVQPRVVTVQFTENARATAPHLLMAGNRVRARDMRQRCAPWHHAHVSEKLSNAELLVTIQEEKKLLTNQSIDLWPNNNKKV